MDTTEVDADRLRSLADYTRASFLKGHSTPFGCDIVNSATGKRLFRGVNAVGLEQDPTSHAELRAIRKACKKLGSGNLRGFTLYTTCEPCPMCMGAVLWSGIDRMVFGATISDAAKHGGQIHVSAKTLAAKSDMPCEVVGPVERKACYSLFHDPAVVEGMKRWQLKEQS